jgi:hypothetical protein
MGSSTTVGMDISSTNRQSPQVIQQNIHALEKDGIRKTCLDANVLISSNTGNDYHPRMTTNGFDQPIVVYEQESNTSSKKIPVVYSADHGQTWTRQFLIDSHDIIDNASSGILQYPDIVYNTQNDLLYLTMIDPDADMYNNEMGFIQGDIANATEGLWYGISGSGGLGYFYNACTCTNNFFLSLITWDAALNQTLGLSWFVYPDFTFPPGMGGFYYDGNSLFQSAPAAELEMDSNSNQVFSVFETHLNSGTYISIKTNIMDEGLITSGEQKDGMDKYADPEQMPGAYLGLGTDPDVSGSGNKVCVVYVEGGNIICKSSTTSAVYDPGFKWYTSIVDTDASAPAVYMSGNNVYCVFVKGENLYLKISEDSGVTWGAAERKNAVDGTVVAEKGAVDIGKTGIAFTDTRNGNYDIYFSSYTARPTPELSITGLIPLKMAIKNVGNAPAYNVSWNITVAVKKGFIFPGKFLSGTVLGSLAPGQEMTLGKQQLLFGLGSIEVIGAAWAENAPIVSTSYTAKLIWVFLFIT